MRQFRNRPKHALYGVTVGATSLMTSIASGIEGLAVRIALSQRLNRKAERAAATDDADSRS